VERVENIAHKDDIQFFNRAIFSITLGCKVCVLTQAFGEQIKCADWNGCGGGAVSKMKVADNNKHGISPL
jgi:hypothetical protein